MAKTRQTIVVAASEYGTVAKFVWLPHLAQYRQSVEIDDDTRALPARYLNPVCPPYPRLPLSDDEPIAVTKAPLFYLWPPVVALLTLGFSTAALILQHWPQYPWASGIAGVCGLLLAYRRYTRWWSNVWYITNATVSYRRRSWNVDTKWILHPADIQTVKASPLRPQWLLGWLTIGTVRIQTSTYGEVVLKLINRCKYTEKAIQYVRQGPTETNLRQRITELVARTQEQGQDITLLEQVITCLIQHLPPTEIRRALAYQDEFVSRVQQFQALPNVAVIDDTLNLDDFPDSPPSPDGKTVGRARVQSPQSDHTD